MGARYALSGNATNTASATLPMYNVVGGTGLRIRIYDVLFGSDAVADAAAKYTFQRSTTAGTAGSSLTPQPLDPADAAAEATSGLAVFSAGPTLTASAFLLDMACNQRATVRWVASPGGELVVPATASNGISVLPRVASTAFNAVFTQHHEE